MDANHLLFDGHPPGAGNVRPQSGRRRAPSAPASERRSGLFFSAGLAVLLAVAVAYLLDPHTLPIRLVRVDGEFRHLSPAALQARAENVVRGGFFNVNVEVIRSAMLQESWVSEVTVQRIWPDELSLHVQEQVAVARWGEDVLLNEQGRPFKPDAGTLPGNLPVLHGPSGAESEVLARFRSLQRAFAPHHLSVVDLRLSERRSWSFTLAGGPSVDLGRSDIAARVERFVAYVPAFLAGDLTRMDVVDMRYTNGFAVRWKTADADGANAGRDNHGQTES